MFEFQKNFLEIDYFFTEIIFNSFVHYCCNQIKCFHRWEVKMTYVSSILIPHPQRSEEVRSSQYPFLSSCKYPICTKTPCKHTYSSLLLQSLICLFNLCAGKMKTPHKIHQPWLFHPCLPQVFFQIRLESRCKFVFFAFIGWLLVYRAVNNSCLCQSFPGFSFLSAFWMKCTQIFAKLALLNGFYCMRLRPEKLRLPMLWQ